MRVLHVRMRGSRVQRSGPMLQARVAVSGSGRVRRVFVHDYRLFDRSRAVGSGREAVAAVRHADRLHGCSVFDQLSPPCRFTPSYGSGTFQAC